MDIYTHTAYQLARQLTEQFSTSFSSSSSLFDASIRPAIYAIYGFVRIADEIVDTYAGTGADELLNALERDGYRAIETGYSTNPIVHAFADTARAHNINETLIGPFFASMRTDLAPVRELSEREYAAYIHGSAEVVGLMCLKVFTGGDDTQFEQLKPGATALGAAYQKVNFLRDAKSDFEERGRVYFPGLAKLEDITDETKARIIANIRTDFKTAKPAIVELPRSAKRAVHLSYLYYYELLTALERAPASQIRTERIRVPAHKKAWLYIRARWGNA